MMCFRSHSLVVASPLFGKRDPFMKPAAKSKPSVFGNTELHFEKTHWTPTHESFHRSQVQQTPQTMGLDGNNNID